LHVFRFAWRPIVVECETMPNAHAQNVVNTAGQPMRFRALIT